MNIKLHIDSLVLQGFNSADRGRIVAAMQQELTRLLAERGVPPSLGQGDSVAQVDGGQFQITPGDRAGAIGSRVAQHVYKGLTGAKL